MKVTTRLTLKKYQNHLIVGIILVVLLAGVVWSARPTTAPEEGGATVGSVGALSAEATSYDFGTISMANGKVSRLYKIRNTSSAPVTMKKLYTSCMCTTAALKHGGQTQGPYGMPGHGIVPTFSEIMNPGEEAEVEVTFDPAAHGPAGVGRVSRVVYLENDAGKPLELRFSALVTP